MLPQVIEAMNDVFAEQGNASSVHGEGRQHRKRIENARAKIASLVNCDVDGVTFTSSATEAVFNRVRTAEGPR